MIINCKRIMALVRRDMVESTPVIIFNHEYAILQAIHGEDNVTIVTDPDRVIAQSTEGLTKEERELQIEKMLQSQDLESADEYSRLVERYGMHPEVSVPNVEYVHGRANLPQWISAMKSDVDGEEDEKPRRGRPPKHEQAATA